MFTVFTSIARNPDTDICDTLKKMVLSCQKVEVDGSSHKGFLAVRRKNTYRKCLLKSSQNKMPTSLRPASLGTRSISQKYPQETR